jgi:hypothetical protein
MKKFICPACGKKISVFNISNRYNKEEDSFTCKNCKLSAKLRHFTKGIKIKEIEKERIKKMIIWCIISIPFQTIIFYSILERIFL